MSQYDRFGRDAVRHAWNANADYWDERMAEGNDFFRHLVWPATTDLLGEIDGQTWLDIACGNGLTSRRLAAAGAEVVAFDIAENLIAHARRRTVENADRIRYEVLDGADPAAFETLGRFDGALCNMALFDMRDIGPLFESLGRALAPGGPFVFSVLHPCFNNPWMRQVAELQEWGGEVAQRYGVTVFKYLSDEPSLSLAMFGQPEPHPLYHRPLSVLLEAGFKAGFALDGLKEAAFDEDVEAGSFELAWSGKFHEIPPVMVCRMRTPA